MGEEGTKRSGEISVSSRCFRRHEDIITVDVLVVYLVLLVESVEVDLGKSFILTGEIPG